jgi:4-amino-4-deoxy-L-arabinose transferase-like glycosyltransferase
MLLSDYFNYMSTLSTVTFLVALFVLIPLGLFLCRYKLKFVIISILGLIQTTVYLSQILMLVVNYLKTANHNIVGSVLEYGIPVGFFIVVGLGIIRYGLQIWVNHWQYQPLRPVVVRSDLKTRLQKWFRFLLKWTKSPEGIGVCIIEMFVLVIHLIFIAQPASIGLLDEGYYIPEALRFLYRLPMSIPEHPPLGKWLIASGIYIFGNGPVGWRIMSVFFSLIGIFIFYLIIKNLTAKWPQASPFVPLLGVFLFATENMTFVMGHVATLDVFYVTLMLLGFFLYLRGNYTSCGIAMGLSLLCKVTALLGVAAILLHWVITHRREIVAELRNVWTIVNERGMLSPLSNNILNMFKMLVFAVAVWLVLIVPLEYGSAHQFTSNTFWYNPLFRAIYMLWYAVNMSSANLAQGMLKGGSMVMVRTPIMWILSPSSLNINLTSDVNVVRYLDSIGWNIWVLIIPSFLYLIYASVTIRETGHDVALFLACWLLCIYGALVVLQLATGRLMYDYYFYPAVPAVCLTIAWGFWRVWELARKRVNTRVAFITGLSLYVLGSLVVFVIMSPLGTHLIKLPL